MCDNMRVVCIQGEEMSRPGARHGDTPHNKYTPEQVRKWREEWKSGMTLSQISQKNKVDVKTISKWLAKDAAGEL